MATVTFTNKSQLLAAETTEGRTERRQRLVGELEPFLASHKRFAGQALQVTFLGNGIKSLAALIETKTDRVVFKLPLSTKHSTGEALFLRMWQQTGVRTPKIIEEGFLGEHPYAFLEYIDAQPLKKTRTLSRLLEEETFIRMGQLLRMMHEPRTSGYGQVIDGEPEYSTFNEWIKNLSFERSIAYVREHQLLTPAHGSLDEAISRLATFAKDNPSSSYCHGDFSTYNVLDTEPLTVIDPNPRFMHGYFDLAWTLYVTVRIGNPDEVRLQYLRGYFGSDHYDTEALRAALLLHAYTRLPYSHREHKAEYVQNVQTFLANNSLILSQ